ncbi:hydroxyproline-rich glyco [Fusarium longipes]|uniref:Hydroxyproline-rich glyco n=1 Tax=Fusarium longipes TaxID=694270 RepID=A0A395S9A8_9HYPO|nr:hydroxyproline-rich glyco [Fusarium longipes]
MGESGTATSAEADGSEASKKDLPPVVDIDAAGDIVLDVTFETSASTLNKTRRAELAASRKAGTQPPDRSTLKSKVRVAYRVNLAALKKHSKYFSNLLSNSQFREAKLITDIHEKLAQLKINTKEADVQDLPWIPITDDDDATRAAGRENVMEDILNIIHQQPTKTSRGTMSYVTTLAIVADRFDCVAAVARVLNTDLKFKWPLTSNKPLRSEDGRPAEAEQVLRQKILVAWLLGQPMRLQQSSREIIMRGSSLWSEFHDPDTNMTAAWWNLPDGLEEELRYRRESILNTVSSVQRHFLALFSSRERQCKLGYDSSAACDSYQLGQMLKFFVNKNLLFLVDYSPASLNMVPDTAMIEIEELLTTLQQCPSYQVDKNHTNCGLRTRLEPILSYMRSMLSANVIAIPYADWKKRPTETSWMAQKEQASDDRDSVPKKFQFTRAIANDQRLRYEGALYVDKMARAMFLADEWDWTPES